MTTPNTIGCIAECLIDAERLLANQKAMGGRPIWSPRLIEAVREAVKGLKQISEWKEIDPIAANCADIALDEMASILNGTHASKVKSKD